jgi:hypothetical protein
MIKTVGYIGSVLMVIFSFTFNPYFGIAGLICLTVQTYNAKLYNLVALNIFSIIGFIYQLNT